jgi:hypothetical protein
VTVRLLATPISTRAAENGQNRLIFFVKCRANNKQSNQQLSFQIWQQLERQNEKHGYMFFNSGKQHVIK